MGGAKGLAPPFLNMDNVTIANSALMKLGADSISSLTENTRSAIAINDCFNRVRDEVLRAYNWAFALKRVKLTPTNTTPEFEWEYQYILPSDCLKPVLLFPNSETEYAIEDGFLLCNDKSISLKYIYRNTDPHTWDNNFCEALAWRLAEELAYKITNSTERETVCSTKYLASLKDARFINSNQQTLVPLESDYWKKIRR